MEVPCQHARAGQVWFTFASLSTMLGTAVVSGVFAFMAAARAVYPGSFWHNDLFATVCLAAALLLFAVWRWLATLKRLYPGHYALRRFVASWLGSMWRLEGRSEVQIGGDESAARLLECAQRQEHLLQQLSGQLKEHLAHQESVQRHQEWQQQQHWAWQQPCERMAPGQQ